MRQKHVPLRTCVACGAKVSKRELTRIVATRQGGVVVDPTGRTGGRGAYVCKDAECAQHGLRKQRVEYALRTEITDREWDDVVSGVESRSTPP